MQIVNIGGTPELGDYAVAAALEASPEVYCAKLEAVPRGEQWLWRLVREALEALKDITG